MSLAPSRRYLVSCAYSMSNWMPASAGTTCKLCRLLTKYLDLKQNAWLHLKPYFYILIMKPLFFNTYSQKQHTAFDSKCHNYHVVYIEYV
jgi:hypothetical protein